MKFTDEQMAFLEQSISLTILDGEIAIDSVKCDIEGDVLGYVGGNVESHVLGYVGGDVFQVRSRL